MKHSTLVSDEVISDCYTGRAFIAQETRCTLSGGAFKILLEQRCIGHANVDDVMSCDKPLLKIGYLLDICLTNVPRGGRSFMTVMAVQLQAKMYLKITHKKGLGALIVLSKGLAVTPFSYTRF